jgi:rifampicin phosphotransferase
VKYLTATDSFEVTWSDPADAQLTWTFDQVHAPRPVPRLSMQVFGTFYRDVLGAPAVVANGYGFFHDLTVPPPTQEIVERGVVPVWENEFLPRIREHCQRVRERDYKAMSASQLVEELKQLVPDTVELLRLTLIVVFPFMGPTLAFVQFCEDELGPDGPMLAGTALQGHENQTAAAGVGLADLAQEAARYPAVVEAFRAGRLNGLTSAQGGPEFLAKFQQYLDDYGWRVESWALLHEPTWAEQPTVPLGLIARYLHDPALSPAESVKRSAAQRGAAIATAESRLAPDKRAAFGSLLEAAGAHVSISEGRAMWQLILLGVFRLPALALGRKLVKAGAIDEPNDVFFLDLEELTEAAATSSPTWKQTVATRKADLARCERLQPPPFIGAPPDMTAVPAEMLPVFRHFFGVGILPSEEKNLITGNPASGGVARGIARVIHNLDDSERLEPGDVLVCATTAPPWTPLFAIASAVVTDSGGVLSHSGICAREYAIPCVVGTMVGTRLIPDGATVVVDGTAGTVRVEA